MLQKWGVCGLLGGGSGWISKFFINFLEENPRKSGVFQPVEGDKPKYNEILTKILEKVPFGVCVSFNLVYSCMHTGSKGSPRGETGSSNRMGSTLYLSVIVVGVRVTRISTDKLCGTDVVRGWVASVPYLFILYCEVSYSLQGPARTQVLTL